MSAHSAAEQILAEPTSRRMFQNKTRTAKENSSWPLFFENPPKMHAKWEKLLSSVPLINFVDRKVAITSPELSDLPCNVLTHLTSGLLNIQQAKA